MSGAGRATLLIVDDEEEILSGFIKGMERRGYIVLPAKNGNEALKIIEDRVATFGNPEIKCIISDWMMPELNGIDLLTKLRASASRETPFVLMSGAVTKETLQEAIKKDADGVILKPFSMDILSQKIDDAVKIREKKDLAKAMQALG